MIDENLELEDFALQTEIIEVAAESEPRLFMTTPFNDYTVTEGFLLVFLICMFIAAIYRLIRRFV